ncbi:MAG: restriction endonuclease [Verrucomicrobiae bacterium]|nr:restriction endonuclease [Verrucomicrobiae bacterium]
MAKAVLITKANPTYDDLPENRYHFPARYLKRMEQVVGDWIIYYEPRRTSGDLSSGGERQAYFATAQVSGISKDHTLPDHYYAHIVTPSYIEFDCPVPFKEGSFYFEAALVKEDGSTNKGAFVAVRLIPDHEYELILQAGFAPVLEVEKAEKAIRSLATFPIFEFSDNEQSGFDRPIIERVVRKPFRDAAFSKLVKDAYQQTCAMTGLKIINGGGRSEVQAAHIMPVSENGPDSIRNGLALSGTVHWMFDRGLISIDTDYSILKAKGKLPEQAERLLNPEGVLILPEHAQYKPHENYLRFHRENIFKG